MLKGAKNVTELTTGYVPSLGFFDEGFFTGRGVLISCGNPFGMMERRQVEKTLDPRWN